MGEASLIDAGAACLCARSGLCEWIGEALRHQRNQICICKSELLLRPSALHACVLCSESRGAGLVPLCSVQRVRRGAVGARHQFAHGESGERRVGEWRDGVDDCTGNKRGQSSQASGELSSAADQAAVCVPRGHSVVLSSCFVFSLCRVYSFASLRVLAAPPPMRPLAGWSGLLRGIESSAGRQRQPTQRLPTPLAHTSRHTPCSEAAHTRRARRQSILLAPSPPLRPHARWSR